MLDFSGHGGFLVMISCPSGMAGYGLQKLLASEAGRQHIHTVEFRLSRQAGRTRNGRTSKQKWSADTLRGWPISYCKSKRGNASSNIQRKTCARGCIAEARKLEHHWPHALTVK